MAGGEFVENISFNSTVFFEFLDYLQSVRILSNFEPEKPVTIFLLFSVCLWSVFRAIRGLVRPIIYWRSTLKKQLINTQKLILSRFLAKQPCSIQSLIFGVMLIYSCVRYMYTEILWQMVEMLTCSLGRLLLINLAMKECSC